MRWLITGIVALIPLIIVRKWMDMVHQRAFEQVQEQASLEKVRFLQRLDHELKNPLAAMQIALANLETATDPQKGEEIRASLHGQIMRISHLIGDLRKLVSLEKNVFEQVKVDVQELLDEVLLNIIDHALVSERQFVVDFNPTLRPAIIGDRDLIQLVVYNLIDNACKFSDVGDRVTLRADVIGQDLVLQVIDTGRGIPEVDVPHVWEDLYRSPDVHGIPGSGIGLAMVKSIIEQHGGTVEIDSVFHGGTTVTIRMPIKSD